MGKNLVGEHHLATADNQQSSGNGKGGLQSRSASRGVEVVSRPETNGINSTESL